mmetsp:Transcript_109575/g.316817  ORF Transcript_109575/g.316817 Transcript_109575/m.316817 type:complete len:310 (+) Transcript_109575:2-931(+)
MVAMPMSPALRLPEGPPPPEIAGYLVCIRWLVLLMVAVSIARLVVDPDPFMVLGDSFGLVAGAMLLRDDAVLGGCGKCFQRCSGGLCGEGGLGCAMTFAGICMVNAFFGGYNVIQAAMLYHDFCYGHGGGDADPLRDSKAEPLSSTRFLAADAAAAHASSGGAGGDASGGAVPADGGMAVAVTAKQLHAACPLFIALGVVLLVQEVLNFAAARVTFSMLTAVRDAAFGELVEGPWGYGREDAMLGEVDEMALQQALAMSREEARMAAGGGARGQGGAFGQTAGNDDIALQRAIMASQSEAFVGRPHRLG